MIQKNSFPSKAVLFLLQFQQGKEHQRDGKGPQLKWLSEAIKKRTGFYSVHLHSMHFQRNDTELWNSPSRDSMHSVILLIYWYRQKSVLFCHSLPPQWWSIVLHGVKIVLSGFKQNMPPVLSNYKVSPIRPRQSYCTSKSSMVEESKFYIWASYCHGSTVPIKHEGTTRAKMPWSRKSTENAQKTPKFQTIYRWNHMNTRKRRFHL